MTSAPLFSPDSLGDMWHDRPEVCRRLVGLFLSDLSGQVTEIERLLRANNPAAARGIAHSLKSSARQVGALSLGDAAAQVEAMCARATGGYTDHDFQSYLDLLVDLTPPTIQTLKQQIEE